VTLHTHYRIVQKMAINILRYSVIKEVNYGVEIK